jgi:choline kinase
MEYVLLSAGKGLRMLPLTADKPKCLIQVDGNTTVLESQLKVLDACGAKKVHIVAGYFIDQVESMLDSLDTKMDLNIIHNPFYNTSNNIISLWLATNYIKGPCISINGDNIFKPEVINALLDSPGEIIMTTDIKKEYDSDDMLVRTEDGLVKEVGKDLNIETSNGESLGIIKYSQIGWEKIRSTLDEMLRKESNHQIFYLSALQLLMNKGEEIHSCEVDATAWAEIDFHPDVDDVRSKIDLFMNKLK